MPIAALAAASLGTSAGQASAMSVPKVAPIATSQAATPIHWRGRWGGPGWGGGGWRRPYFYRPYRPFYGVYGGVGYGYYGGGGYGGCGWLHRRAEITGSRYWWRRYRDCAGW